jgi:hypothetical protein
VFDADPNYQLLAIGADAALTYFPGCWRGGSRRGKYGAGGIGNGAAVAALPLRDRDY